MNEDIRPLSPFQEFCVKFLGYIPSSYDDCMTYLECLIYTYNYLKNEIVPTVKQQNVVVQELKNYVEHYFDNLDVQEEINNKLDAMATDGSLEEIITDYIQLKSVLAFDTVSDMKTATNLVDGSYAETYGYHTLNDGGGARYKVRTITNDDVVDEMTIIELADDSLIAELIIDEVVIPEKLGAYGDGTHDDTIYVQKAFDLSKNIILNGLYKCTSDIVVTDGKELTITGINYNKSGIKLYNESQLIIGNNTMVNELRLNNLTIAGDRSQSVVLKIKYITNVTLNQINIAEGSGHLLELDHADIVFIDKCTFAGSNETNIWQPCAGIKMTNSNPVRITNSNIWNLTTFIDVNNLTRFVYVANNWIEFVSKIINSENVSFNHTHLIVENNNITYPHHGTVTFTSSRIINLNTITDPFDTLISVKNNNIIYYTDYPTEALVELTSCPSQLNVYIENNIMFTRLSQMSAYALKVDAKRDTKLYYTSTTNADKAYGCATDGVLNTAYSPRELNIKNLNLSATDNEIPLIANMDNGHIWYNGGLYIKDSNALKRIPISTRPSIDVLPNTGTATTVEIATKLNELITDLKGTNIIS